jgi:DedD protein
MAKPQPVTEQEISLRKRARRRLVGAVALVLVVAVVLPWVVDDDPPPRLKNVDIAIPAVESVDRKFPSAAPVAEPIPAPGAATPQGPADTTGTTPAVTPAESPVPEQQQTAPAQTPAAPAMSAPDPEASPPKSVANPEPKATAKPDAKAEGKPAANAAPGRGFVMQVGAFSSSDKARQLQQQLRAAGFPAYLESVKTTSGERTRVRAGPFATVEAAQKARSRLLGLKVAQGDLKVVPREN